MTMIPLLVHYSMFGLGRAGDLVWAASHNHRSDARLAAHAGHAGSQVARAGGNRRQGRRPQDRQGNIPLCRLGRAAALDRSGAIIKAISDQAEDRAIGAATLGADAVDPGHTIHPRPTPDGTVNIAAGIFKGITTGLMQPKKRS